MSLSGDILSDMQMDASIEAIGEIAGSINLDGSGSTPTITASATVSPDPGIPACNVVKTGTDEYPNFAFNFSGLKGEPGEQGLPGQNGQNGADGSDGITPNLTATASVGASTGTPAVTVTRIGTDENPNFYFQFDNLKGEQGIQGEQGEPGSQGAPGSVPNVSASASVTNTSGTPAVTVTRTGSDAAPNFDFAFENLKGEQGIQGVPGQNGQNGADGSDGVTPIVSATASADNSYGIPNVVVTRSGTDVAPSFDFAFHNIKGEPGTSGVPAGGATGQVLAKESNDDWDCDWQTLVIPSTAAEINFDNTGTGMTATDVQDAVTELKSNLTDLESEVDDKLKLTVIRSVATWNVGSSYTFTQEDWDKYTEFHVFISHANVANPSYYEVVFNKYFYTVQRIVGYGGTSGNNYVQMSGDATNKRLTLNAAVNASTAYNPLIGIYGR